MPHRSIQVVLVEDDADDAYLASQALTKDESRRYELNHVETLSELMELSLDSVDVILLDLGLPDSNGLSSVVHVINHFRNIPVIVLTGLKSEELGELAIQLGAEDYIPKDELNSTMLSRSIRFSIERHGLLQKLRNMAHVDSLTLLSNRADFEDKIESMLDYATRHQTKLGLLMVDLDGFKQVNDSLGHGAGDQVLAQFAARLKNRTRKSDVVARLGGDEFVLLLQPVESLDACEQVAKSKLECVKDPFLIYVNGAVHEVNVGMSIGIALYPDHAQSARNLKDCADKAMYDVKSQGKNHYRVYSSDEQKTG